MPRTPYCTLRGGDARGSPRPPRRPAGRRAANARRWGAWRRRAARGGGSRAGPANPPTRRAPAPSPERPRTPGPPARPPPGPGKGQSQVVGEAARAEDEHTLVGERRDGAAERPQPRWRLGRREGERHHRHIRRGPHVHQHRPDAVVQSAALGDPRLAPRGAQQRRCSLRHRRLARCVVSQLVQRRGKAREVVYGLVPLGGEQHRAVGQRVGRARQHGPRSTEAALDGTRQACEEGPRGTRLEGHHRRTVRHEQRRHRPRRSVAGGRRRARLDRHRLGRNAGRSHAGHCTRAACTRG